MTAMECVRVALEEHDCRPTGTGGQLAARCPAHNDGSPSLSLTSRDGRALLYCHAGCTTAEVLAALNLKDADLFDEPLPKGERATRQETHYEYRNADGQVVGRVTRRHPKKFVQSHPDGRGGWVWKASDDLKVTPYRLPEVLAAISRGETVYVVEGEKDVHTLASRGAVATCNAGGAGKWTEAHAKHLHGADVVVVRDNDEAGHSHADKVMRTLAGVAAAVRLADVADGCKDVTDHLSAGHGLEDLRAPSLPQANPAASTDSGSEEKQKPSQASQLAGLARKRYELFMSEDGRPYGRKIDGPNVALPLRGKAGLRSQLALIYADEHTGAVPSQAALSDCMTVLEGAAASVEPRVPHMRVARHGDCIVVDLATSDGRCVVISPDGWERSPRSPVLFRRSGAMKPLPEPIRDGDGLTKLRNMLNTSEEGFRLLVAWLIAGYIPDLPHPILTFRGEQGTGKSKAAQMVIGILDPSGAPKRTQPRDIKAWATQAFNSWALCLDNVSVISDWLSDALCRAVTGDGIVDRALYTDDDVVVLEFRRVLAMTTIDAGALAGDLAERLLTIELNLIPDADRREESELDAAYAQAHASILASLFDLLSRVLGALPHVELTERPRMADFARVLAAVDKVQGWTTLDSYKATARDAVTDVLDGEPFAQAIVKLVDHAGVEGLTLTASELLAKVDTPERLPKKWPKDSTRAGGQIKRLAPALRTIGIEVDDSKRGPAPARQRMYRLTASPERRSDTASTASTEETNGALTSSDGVDASKSSAASTHIDEVDADGHSVDADLFAASTPGPSSDQRKRAEMDARDARDAGMHSLTGAASSAHATDVKRWSNQCLDCDKTTEPWVLDTRQGRCITCAAKRREAS